MVGALAFGDVNGDGRCDVTVSADGTVFHGGRAAGGRATATLKAAAKRTDLVWAPPYTGWGTGGQGLLGRLSPTLHFVVDEAPVSLIKETTLGEAGNVSPTGRVLGTGDFNGDGATDLLWDNGGGGITQFIRVTLLDGSSASTSGNIVVPGPLGRTAGATSGVSADRGVLPPNAQLAGIGDFNADGRSDILWRREDGQLLLWFAGESWNSALVTWGNNLDVDGNGIGHPQDAPVPVDWQVQGIGDFDGDGYSHILWRHDGGQVAIWYMVHAMHVGDAYPGGTDPTRVWEIQGVGDFDGDGQADILWRDVHGALAIWVHGLYDTGLRPTHPGIIGYEWQIHGVGDFNADGHTDLLWRHTTAPCPSGRCTAEPTWANQRPCLWTPPGRSAACWLRPRNASTCSNTRPGQPAGTPTRPGGAAPRPRPPALARPRAPGCAPLAWWCSWGATPGEWPPSHSTELRGGRAKVNLLYL